MAQIAVIGRGFGLPRADRHAVRAVPVRDQSLSAAPGIISISMTRADRSAVHGQRQQYGDRPCPQMPGEQHQ